MSLQMATPDQRRRNFEAFIAARNLVTAKWAKDAEVGPSTIYDFLNGRSDSLGTKILAKLAKAAGVSQTDLTAAIEEGKLPIGKSGEVTAVPLSRPDGFRPINVVGIVEAGVWREALQWDADEIYQVSMPIPPAFAGLPVFALEVRGPSMNALYPNKSVVFCVRYLDVQREPSSGERVVVYRRNAGELMEATLKEFIVDDKGAKWLRPRSTHPDFQKPWRVHEGARDEHEFEVYALVIGSFRPEV